MSQEKLSVEAKIKQIDEQIAMLTKLKSQYPVDSLENVTRKDGKRIRCLKKDVTG